MKSLRTVPAAGRPADTKGGGEAAQIRTLGTIAVRIYALLQKILAVSETPAYDEEIAESLKSLGFPESILKDLSSEDIAQCEGADMVRVSSYIHDNNYNSYRDYLDSEYKTAENGTCTVAHIAVRIPTEINGTEWHRWYVINYFIWPGENNFKGNELMWLTTLYNRGTFDVVTYPFEMCTTGKTQVHIYCSMIYSC